MSETSTLIGYAAGRLAAKNWHWYAHHRRLKRTARSPITRSCGPSSRPSGFATSE